MKRKMGTKQALDKTYNILKLELNSELCPLFLETIGDVNFRKRELINSTLISRGENSWKNHITGNKPFRNDILSAEKKILHGPN